MTTARPIAPPAHRSLPRAPLRRSWGHSAPRAGPSHGPPDRSPNPPVCLDQEDHFQHTLNTSVVFASASDHHRLESVITIACNR